MPKFDHEIQDVRQEIRDVEQRVIGHVNNKFNELAGLIKGLAVARKPPETPPQSGSD